MDIRPIFKAHFASNSEWLGCLQRSRMRLAGKPNIHIRLGLSDPANVDCTFHPKAPSVEYNMFSDSFCGPLSFNDTISFLNTRYKTTSKINTHFPLKLNNKSTH